MRKWSRADAKKKGCKKQPSGIRLMRPKHEVQRLKLEASSSQLSPHPLERMTVDQRIGFDPVVRLLDSCV